MPYQYQAYGIPIVSDIELPALCFSDENSTAKPINVERGIVPDLLQSVSLEEKPFTTLNVHEFRYEMPNMAKYYVANGEQVIIEPLCENWEEILLYFYANCMAAILFQRGLIPFHVSGVFVDEQSVLLFAAPSRTGKSTTALMLQQRGYAPFTDDTAVLTVEEGVCYAQASYPMMRLWQNTIEQQTLLAEVDKMPVWADAEIDKYGFHFHEQFVSQKVRVAGIVFLEEARTEITIETLKPIQTIQLLGNNIYRGHWLNGMKKGRIQFELLTKICHNLKSYKATRPQGTATFDTFAETIEKHIINQLIKMTYEINSDKILFTQLGDEGVVYGIETNEYLTLNETYFKILQGVEQGKSQPEIVTDLYQEYDIDHKQCETEVAEALQTLAAKQYISTL